MRHYSFPFLLVIFILLLAGVAQADDWPMLMGDIAHNGAVDFEVKPPLRLLWEFDGQDRSEGDIRSSPVISNNILYTGDGRAVYALYANNGSFKWKYVTEDNIVSSPTIVNGFLYIGSNDANLYALNTSDGSLKWKYKTEGAVKSSPTVFENTVYVGSTDGMIYAFDADIGSLRWKYVTGGAIYSSPSVYNNTLYIGSNDTNVYAIDVDTGSLRWKYVTGGAIYSSPALYNNSLYIGSIDSNVYALDADTGSLRWKYVIEGAIYSSPVVYDENIYIGSWGLYAIDTNSGQLKWRSRDENYFYSSPTIAGNFIYIGAFNYEFFGLDRDTGNVEWSHKSGDEIGDGYGFENIYSSIAITNGTIFVKLKNGRISAFSDVSKLITLVSEEIDDANKIGVDTLQPEKMLQKTQILLNENQIEKALDSVIETKKEVELLINNQKTKELLWKYLVIYIVFGSIILVYRNFTSKNISSVVYFLSSGIVAFVIAIAFSYSILSFAGSTLLYLILIFISVMSFCWIGTIIQKTYNINDYKADEKTDDKDILLSACVGIIIFILFSYIYSNYLFLGWGIWSIVLSVFLGGVLGAFLWGITSAYVGCGFIGWAFGITATFFLMNHNIITYYPISFAVGIPSLGGIITAFYLYPANRIICIVGIIVGAITTTTTPFVIVPLIILLPLIYYDSLPTLPFISTARGKDTRHWLVGSTRIFYALGSGLIILFLWRWLANIYSILISSIVIISILFIILFLRWYLSVRRKNRQHIEKMKQEILDMISEVTKKVD